MLSSRGKSVFIITEVWSTSDEIDGSTIGLVKTDLNISVNECIRGIYDKRCTIGTDAHSSQ